MSFLFRRAEEKTELEKGIERVQKMNEQIIAENIELKEKIKNDLAEIEGLKKKKEELEKAITELKELKNNKEELKYYNDNKTEKYYDIVININSLKGIKTGWNIKWTDENSKNYEKLINNECIRVGVIGNGNKGKSFILQKFSGNELPKGTSIKTEGLSLLYPKEGKMDNIVLMDSAGFETPLLKSHNIEEEGETKLTENKISDIAKDKIFTELFLQKLIIQFSDVLLIVVGILTFSEQKLLNRIKKTLLIKQGRYQKIFIIHNLQSFVEINQVEDYIKNILLNSATFAIKPIGKAGFEKINEKRNLYIEEYENIIINHLIMANEGSNAGNYYNSYMIKYLKNNITSLEIRKKLDVINEIRNNFIEFSKEVLETYTKSNKEYKTLSNDDIIFNEKENKIELNNSFEINFKKLLVDELGISNFRNNNCEPKYSYYKVQKEKECFLEIKVELPGKYENLKGVCYIENEYSVFDIRGEKLKEDDDKNDFLIRDNREYGKFIIILPLKTSEILFQEENATICEKSDKGIVIFSFKILDMNRK